MNFTNATSNGNSYKWSFGNGSTSVLTDPSVKYSKSGTFTVKLDALSSQGCAASLSKTAYITVVAYPKAALSASPVITDILSPSVTFTDQSSGHTAFNWEFGDGQSDNTGSVVVHNYGDTGTYRAMLVVQNSLGCADTAYQILRVNDVYRFFLPTSFTPNADTRNDALVPGGRGVRSYTMEVFNRWGEKVFESTEAQRDWNGKDKNGKVLESGNYVVVVVVLDHEDKRHVIQQSVMLLY